MKYTIPPLIAPSLETTGEQYDTYLKNYEKYIEAVKSRKSAVKSILKERDEKAVKNKKGQLEASKTSKIEGAKEKRKRDSKAKIRARAAKRKIARLKKRAYIESLEKKAADMAATLKGGKLAKKAATSGDPGNPTGVKGKTKKKVGGLAKSKRAERRAHLQPKKSEVPVAGPSSVPAAKAAPAPVQAAKPPPAAPKAAEAPKASKVPMVLAYVYPCAVHPAQKGAFVSRVKLGRRELGYPDCNMAAKHPDPRGLVCSYSQAPLEVELPDSSVPK